MPDAEALETITGNTYYWADAKAFAAAYDDGTNSDYRLITKSEALEILTNNDLLSQLGLTGNEDFWTIEEIDLENAYVFAGIPNNVYGEDKVIEHLVFPVRKANFYGLPLIESEYGGGLVYDVVAATRTVSIAAKWEDVITAGYHDVVDWVDAVNYYPALIPLDGVEFTSPPTRAQALKIFGNSYLVALAGLPVDDCYWTSEQNLEYTEYAYIYDVGLGVIAFELKTESYYALPVRSEVVPET